MDQNFSWLGGDWIWRLRGLIDRALGGPGLRRTRPPGDRLQMGDMVDFFRVERVETNRLLRLHAQMRPPGTGGLQFQAKPVGKWQSEIVQAVFFAPKGLPALMYWYAL